MSSISSARTAPLSAREVGLLKESAFVGGVAGLQLVVSRGGTRSWRIFYRIAGADGRRRAITLGRYPAVSLKEARHRAAEALAQASNGEDPKTARVKKAAEGAKTTSEVVKSYLAACAGANDPKTLRDKRSALSNHFIPAFGVQPIIAVSKADLLLLLDSLADRPAIRRNLYTYLHHLFRWALERDLVKMHPLQNVQPPKPVAPRDRVLSDEEIRALWCASGPMAEIARLLLLTAQRKGSVEAMRRDEIDEERRLWSIPPEKMKSAKPHLVPLSETALEIIRRQLPMEGPHIFGVGTHGAKPYAGASKGFVSLRRQTGEADWRLHDIRRTAVTLAQRGGAGLEEIRALTQHKVAGVIGVYARHTFADEKIHVATIIERQVLEIVGV